MKGIKSMRTSETMNLRDSSVCPTCNGTGWINAEKVLVNGIWYENIVKPCPACNGGLEERTETMKKVSNIPSVFYNSDLKNFDWSIYKDEYGKTIDMRGRELLINNFIAEYKEWKKEGYGLYIFSETKGSGKTFLASCICNELMKRYAIRTKFVSAVNLLNIAQSGDKESYDEYKKDPIKLLCNCELLVIDDIGQKKGGYDWMNDLLFRIVDERMTQKLVTIFTSNIVIDRLSLDERITERINKMSHPVSLPEFNVRHIESNNNKAEFLKRIGLVKVVKNEAV
ncbi:DNA replication protein DnaC [Eubacterium ruminantium]|uniref:DNA replication protein DnaC n=2 Tax=Eubacterium ruminantium TaxID=42322 RepID=A0A1T4QUZ2_9FIRM|nr:DNA replication protein DnaC [Eubacterium ruminantium]SDM12298.1 DNA replication protein DnaC [Eubacterium ruminantium]SKA07524.1 DNA replication protein DnaC [Eubacterium ruminantium]